MKVILFSQNLTQTNYPFSYLSAVILSLWKSPPKQILNQVEVEINDVDLKSTQSLS